MNVGEFGVVIRFATNKDLTQVTDLTLELTKPSATVLLYATPYLVVGAAPLSVTRRGEVRALPAGSYAEYVTRIGDIDEAGWWSARLTGTFPDGAHLRSRPDMFAVGE